MELASKKGLTLLCALFFAAAAVEGFLLYRNHINFKPESRYLEYDLSHPLAFSKNFMRGWDEDSFFGGKFPKENLFQESFTLTEPRRQDNDKEVRLIFDIKGHENGNYEVKVEDGQLTLVGKDDQKSQQKETKSIWPWSKKTEEEPQVMSESHWSQTQIFPLPEDADPKKYAIERNRETFTVVFKKVPGDSVSL